MDHKEFQIHTYGFGELAQLYFPHIAKPFKENPIFFNVLKFYSKY